MDICTYGYKDVFDKGLFRLKLVVGYGKVKRASVEYETEERLKQLIVYDLELVDIGEFQSNKFGENVDELMDEYERVRSELDESA